MISWALAFCKGQARKLGQSDKQQKAIRSRADGLLLSPALTNLSKTQIKIWLSADDRELVANAALTDFVMNDLVRVAGDHVFLIGRNNDDAHVRTER